MSNTDAERVCVVCALKCAGLRLGIRVAVCGYVRGLGPTRVCVLEKVIANGGSRRLFCRKNENR